MKSNEIETKIKQLPDHIVQEIDDFIDFLLHKYSENKGNKGKFDFDWEGELSTLRNKFTSVELQRKVTEWR